MRIPVFVYGSLKSGNANSFLLEGAIFAGDYRTDSEYSLYNLGHFPAVVPEGNTSIIGEVYLVDDTILEDLDALEGYPDFYDRTLVKVHPLGGPAEQSLSVGEALMYFVPKGGFDIEMHEKVESGNW